MARSLALISLSALLVGMAPADPAAAQDDVAAAPSATPYVTRVREGIRQAMSRDFAAAVATLRQAIQEGPSEPIAYYHLGSVQRMNGQLAEALETFRTGARIAESAQNDVAHARCLQAIADTLERQGVGSLQPAREAWSVFARFADGHRIVANPEIARARIQAIDQALEQEAAYVAVRQRIAEREQASQQGGQQGPTGQRRGQRSGP